MGRRPATPSSETDTRSRERLVPDRDGASREGGGGVPPSSEVESHSRVVRPSSETVPTRGGDRPSSEADLYRGSAVPLERSRVLPEGGWADCLTGRGPAVSFCLCVYVCLRLFFTSLSGFPLVV
jgi:hypothetical protein